MAVIGGVGLVSTWTSPPQVTHGIVRPAVLRLLDERWVHAVTTVVAGAGFGKSIAVGQAMRANQARPRGVEGWLSCRSGCEDPARFAGSVRAAFLGPGEAAGTRGDPLAAVLETVTGFAPVETALILDDVETLASLPACVDLLDRLVRCAAPGVHLVLVGRSLPPLHLSRLRAAGQVLAVGQDDLRFTDTDVAALARSMGKHLPKRDLGGWPALVRLALTAPEGVDDFLGEEVVAGLATHDRRALAALCILGPSTPDDVSEVCGTPFDAPAFRARVPLVHRANGRIVAHALWEPALARLMTQADVAAMSRRALEVVSARGDPVATGMLAVRLGDQPTLERAMVALVRATLGSLPVDVADAWLAAADTRSPAIDLLACAREHARGSAETERLDGVVAQFRSVGDRQGEAVALALAAIEANAHGDLVRLMRLADHARNAVGASQEDPILRLLVAAVDAAVAAVGGDINAALSLLEEPIPGLDPADRPEAVGRLHWHLLLLAGQAAEAVQLAAAMPSNPAVPVLRELEAVARWFDGDPSWLVPGQVDVSSDRYAALSERDRFDQASFVAVLAASVGDVGAVDHAVRVLESSQFSGFVPADMALVAVARAAQKLVHHDEVAAVTVIDEVLSRPDVDSALVDIRLRRSPAIGYVCSARLRERWDTAELGLSQQRACAIARLLVDARAGRPPRAAPEPLAAVETALPLPWSVELATAAMGWGASWGGDLAEILADRIGPPVHAELERLSEGGDPISERGAAIIRRALPTRPPGRLEIRVLGPLEIRRDGLPVEAPELRRARVRELLSLLVVERTLTRDRAVELLWPDHRLTRDRANLRVTLAHARRLLEPRRRTEDAPYYLRTDAERIRLAAVPGLEVDLWAIEAALVAAEAARQAGDAAARVRQLAAVTELWRGRALPDLDRMDELLPHIRHLSARLVDAVLDLGELQLVGGALAHAAVCAERALGADPYTERAHSLAIAAALHRRDRLATSEAVARLRERLAEVGAEPEAATRMLLRQATAWLDPGRHQLLADS